jgi:hypothetical protein
LFEADSSGATGSVFSLVFPLPMIKSVTVIATKFNKPPDDSGSQEQKG